MATASNNPPSRPQTPPPGAWPGFQAAARRLIVSPVERFLAVEAASGLLLLAAAVAALVWANSPWHASYQALWHTPFGLRLGPWAFQRDLHFWINDGLMVIFFFVVGLEIRREIHNGELSELRRAALPVFAAVGGMIAPALIYLALNGGTAAAAGWGVPTATDIAFAVGVLALLGKRVRPALRVLLLALAVIDDLGAIIVIALFYSSGISVVGLVVAAAGLALILLLQKLGIRFVWAYLPAGLVVWAGSYLSGVHPTLAGVIIGLLTPVRAWEGQEQRSPVERLQYGLHGWVAYVIMPVFALANAGVPLGAARLDGLGTRVLLGVTLGLVIGKPVGIVALSWLAVRMRAAALPRGVRWLDVLAVGMVAGIGFTMALFIASLAFPPGPLIEVAKLGILCASAVAGVAGLAVGRLLLTPAAPAGAAASAADAEASTHA